MVWVWAFGHYIDVFSRLGLPGGYHVRHGNTNAVMIGGLWLAALTAGSIMNVVLGYRAAVSENQSDRNRLWAATFFSLVALPIAVSYALYVIDTG
jgi:hypothetical protein